MVSVAFFFLLSSSNAFIPLLYQATARDAKEANSFLKFYHITRSIAIQQGDRKENRLTHVSRSSTSPFHNEDMLNIHETRLNDYNTIIPLSEFNNESLNIVQKLPLDVLLLDHYDSFTYNLADYLTQLCVEPPVVLAADSFSTWNEIILQYNRSFDCIVLSPGPGNPCSTPTQEGNIFRLARDIVHNNPTLPILGVCLGHQILGDFYGAKVQLSPTPVHGQISQIVQTMIEDDPLFQNIPKVFNVTRYHSLQVTNLQNTPLIGTSRSVHDSVLMSLRHKKYPHWGVQFHPESIGSAPFGMRLLHNFVNIAFQYKQSKHNASITIDVSPQKSQLVQGKRFFQHPHERSKAEHQFSPTFTVYVHKVPRNNTSILLNPSQVMEQFLDRSQFSFWLDGETADIHTRVPANLKVGRSARISILGGHSIDDDPHYQLKRIEYWGKEKSVKQQGLYLYDKNCIQKLDIDILSYLEFNHIQITTNVNIVTLNDEGNQVRIIEKSESEIEDILSFDYRGGYVGYLGYEVRHDTLRYLQEMEMGSSIINRENVPLNAETCSDEQIPTAAFIWADRSFVFDHGTGDWYLIGIVSSDVSASSKSYDNRQTITTDLDRIFDWMRDRSRKLQQTSKQIIAKSNIVGENERMVHRHDPQSNERLHQPQVAFRPNRSRERYSLDFDECIEYIRQGESYELCLTNRLEANVTLPNNRNIESSQPLQLYQILRRRNPAPYSAFINWNSCNSNLSKAALAICCSSPERFVSVHLKNTTNAESLTYVVEAKPIKGTCPRVVPQSSLPGVLDLLHSNKPITWTNEELKEDAERAHTLQTSIKNRAENLMIVDLLRNDLSRVCDTGSVHVAKLFGIESFSTVHQLVSTIRGTLTRNTEKSSTCAPVQVLKALFPGGSMTGAPKVRTMELLHKIEDGVSRGPYSGCLGYISVNGCMDMNIIIRTALLTPSPSRQTLTEKMVINGIHERAEDSGLNLQESSPSLSWNVRVGAGGAITALSENEDEYEEMQLKASAIVLSVEEWVLNNNKYNNKIRFQNSSSSKKLETSLLSLSNFTTV